MLVHHSLSVTNKLQSKKRRTCLSVFTSKLCRFREDMGWENTNDRSFIQHTGHRVGGGRATERKREIERVFCGRYIQVNSIQSQCDKLIFQPGHLRRREVRRKEEVGDRAQRQCEEGSVCRCGCTKRRCLKGTVYPKLRIVWLHFWALSHFEVNTTLI